MNNSINMNRRKFLIKSILGGIGFSLIPSITFSNSRKVETFEIGKMNIHHRHGNMYSSTPFNVKHKNIKSVTRERFLGNGFCEGDKDAFLVEVITPNRNFKKFVMATDINLVNNNVNVKKGDLLIPLQKHDKTALLIKEDTSIRLTSKYYKIKKGALT